jgi:hypothetical protein
MLYLAYVAWQQLASTPVYTSSRGKVQVVCLFLYVLYCYVVHVELYESLPLFKAKCGKGTPMRVFCLVVRIWFTLAAFRPIAVMRRR